MPSTEVIRAKAMKGKAELPLRPDVWARQLIQAQERDALQATRPEGCWCLGSGESKPETAPTGNPGNHYYTGRQLFCSCPEGLAIKQAHDTEVAEQQANDIQEKEELSEIPRRFADFTLATSPLKKLAKKLALAEPNQSVFLWGDYGTGKTGLAVGYTWAWIEKTKGKRTALFRTLPNLLSELRSTYNPHPEETETEQNLLSQYQNVGLLVLDDIGAEQISAKGAAWMQDRLYQIVGNRHDEMMPMIFTSNMALDELEKRLGERLTWRILEMCGKDHIIEVKGANLRDL